MNIQNFFQYRSDEDNYNRRYPLKIYQTQKLSYLRSFITSSFDVLVQNNIVNIDQLFSSKHDYTIDSETEAVTFDLQTKTVYFFDTDEENQYIDEYCRPYDKPREYYDNLDLTPRTLIKKNNIGFTKIPLDNFIELINDWHELNLQKVPFALLYQDEQDWIACKGFETQEAMETFVKQHNNEQL